MEFVKSDMNKLLLLIEEWSPISMLDLERLNEPLQNVCCDSSYFGIVFVIFFIFFGDFGRLARVDQKKAPLNESFRFDNSDKFLLRMQQN